MKLDKLIGLLKEYDAQKGAFRKLFDTRSCKMDLLAQFIEEKRLSAQLDADFTFEAFQQFVTAKNVTLNIFSDDSLSNTILRKWCLAPTINLNLGLNPQIPFSLPSFNIAPLTRDFFADTRPPIGETYPTIFAYDLQRSRENQIFSSFQNLNLFQRENSFFSPQQNLSQKDMANIRKAARIIAQGTRDSGSLFSKLPDEVGVKIAAYCSDGSLSRPIAESVAQKNFGRPKTT